MHLFPPPLLHSITTTTTTAVIFIFATIYTSYGQNEDRQFLECSQPYRCGNNFTNITYPFWGGNRPQYCGHPEFKLQCENNEYPIMESNSITFRVVNINQANHTMTMARLDLWNGPCGMNFKNTSLDESIFPAFLHEVRDLVIFYGCKPLNVTPQLNITALDVQKNFTCHRESEEIKGFYSDDSFSRVQPYLSSCNESIRVPIFKTNMEEIWNKSILTQEALNEGFEAIYQARNGDCYNCINSGGICGSDSDLGQFLCLCPDKPYSHTCGSSGHGLNIGRKVAIGLGASAVSIIFMVIIFVFYRRRLRKRYAASSLIPHHTPSYSSSTTDLEKSASRLGVHIFNYNELEEATNNFDSSKELGDGGYGTVYQGKLRDGRVVAVKRLFENNRKRVDQFINEVEILTRLRHQNLVSLYGCTSRHGRELLLVYEFVPNGTVADHLHGERAQEGLLTWTTRMKIAIETASALVYLHASDVIHRDVKTTNILLDNNFCVKVADFGLSRLFPNDVTHVSTAPQGTPGYVDPEYHECYQLTDKSDVYSFGVVLAELISSMPAVDITRHRQEINLSNMAINKIQGHALHELVDPSLGFSSDCKVRRMITDLAELAFRCLQNGKEMRPSMEEVLEALKGIMSTDYDAEKSQMVDVSTEDDALLRSNLQVFSPNSVIGQWTSKSTTPSTSG